MVLDLGYQPERVQAAIYLLFHALLDSLTLLFAISFVFSSLGSLCMFLFYGNDDQISAHNNSIFLPICLVANDYVSKSDQYYLRTFNIR